MADLGPAPVLVTAAAAYPSPPNTTSLSPNPNRKPSDVSLSSLSPFLDRPAMASLSLKQEANNPSAYGAGGGPPLANANAPGVAPPGGDKSALSSLNLGFLKTLTEKRTNRDGQAPKRRGPKPDSKPALTRRQELNRQAQRTHRERKELYIKALEDEVLRLKEIYSNLAQDKERLAEENRQLKGLLSQNGMPMMSGGLGPGSGAGGMGGTGGGGSSSGGPHGGSVGGPGPGMLDDSISNPASVGGYTSSGSVTGSYGAPPSSHTSAFTPPPLSAGHSHGLGGHMHHHQGHHHQLSGHGIPQAGGATLGTAATATSAAAMGGSQMQSRNPNLDYDQAGIDFVLTLEKPCMDHMPWLLERSTEVGGNEPCGHALMASCPPEPFPDLTPDIPFGYSNVNGTSPTTVASGTSPATPATSTGVGSTGVGVGVVGGMFGGPLGGVDTSGQRTWELSKADLATLLDLSRRLNLDGEITPVMAWGMVLAHPRLGELRPEDFQRLTEELIGKVRCYGFGAVMEEFEVRDALENVLSTVPDMAVGMVY